MMQSSKIDANKLIARIRGAGVFLWAESGKLRYRAPQGMMNDGDLEQLRRYKQDILGLLQTEAGTAIVEYHPESRHEPFPLTDVQSAYLLGRSEAFEYGGVACHIYLELTYPELDVKRTGKAWNQLILRHDMLRAVMNKDGYQQVKEQTPQLNIAYTDVSSRSKAQVETKLNQIREEMGHRIYNTECWPLFGVAVTKTPAGAVMHFSIEFLIADWASIWLLLSEFESLYYQPEKKLPALTLSFRDYLMAERSLRESPVYVKDKEYWLSRIGDLPPAPELPVASTKARPGKARFSRQSLLVDLPVWKTFKQKAQQRGLTPTIAIMTAYAATIERWSVSNKFCLNLTVLNRLPIHPEVDHIVGDFTSVSLLAVDWEGGTTFTEQAKAMNKQLFEDMDHRLFSGVEVLRELARRRGRDAALMPVVFTSAIGLIGATEENRLKGNVGVQSISQTPQVFIDCQAMDNSSGLQVNWDIREGVFPDGMTDDMFAAFSTALHLLASNDQAWDIGAITALPAWQLQERRLMNDTKVLLPKGLLHGQILEQAAISPDSPAVVDSEGVVTYGELMRRAAAIAEKLQESGCKQQDRVGIVLEKSGHQVAAVLGALLAGAVYVPIDTQQPELRRLAILETTQIGYVLTCSAMKIKWPASVTTVAVDTLQPLRDNRFTPAGDPELPAYIIHTSGSTGQPKGVVITHCAAANTIHDINRRFHVDKHDKILGLAQLGFDLSVYDIFGILSAGGILIYPSAERHTDPSHWAELMAKYEVTIWNSVPAMMQMLVACLNSDNKINLPNLRLALLSGDWIPLTLPDILINRVPSVQVISLGGATEASIWSIFHVYQGLAADWRSIPYGRPLANQGFRVLDKKMRDCPVWVKGDLYITGEGLAQGYFGDTESTQTQFFHLDGQRLYRTGDTGRYIPGGEIEFLGREDKQVKIRGHRIELGEIESALLKHPAVAESAVVLDDPGENKVLTGFVTLNRMPSDAAELAEFLARRLPAYMLPARIQIVDKLPLTGNGKLDRKALKKWITQSAAEPAASSAPQSADGLETKLAEIWAEALSIKAIGRSQNFYDQGADSLIMAQVAGKLRDVFAGEPFKLDIPFDTLLRQMLNYPTVAALAEFVRSQSNNTKNDYGVSQGTQPVNNAGNAVLTFYGGGDEGPLRVIFHAGLGTMNCFHLLLAHLDKQLLGPVVGITVADTDIYCSIEPAELIEHLADDYAKRLIETGYKEMQLIGYCLGGLIAIEVARRLIEKGIQLADLVLVDSHPLNIDDDLIMESLFVPNLHISLADAGFGGVDPEDFVRGLVYAFEANQQSFPAGVSLTIGGDPGLDKVGGLFRKLSSISPPERFTAYVDALANLRGEHMPVEMAAGMFKIYCQSLRSSRFRPQPYVGDIRFLLALEPSMPGMNELTLAYWEQACLGEFSVQEIAGNHLTCIETEPNAGNLAEIIGSALIKK
ncbi:non-ribosomal peptide synthetase [Sporomusa termitida]|uniref:Phenyloxazoline synthase MbtB n=1 Tax=Sporomusa termitida TaxID=2377 RepID=A0A517DRB8_9FIRM|nr:non-ribosomal peptide synthetase [Sporomusa termitida]QDR79901.1 Phenyloxazoline synthase MbtB [Sporomusa termitida]